MNTSWGSRASILLSPLTVLLKVALEGYVEPLEIRVLYLKLVALRQEGLTLLVQL